MKILYAPYNIASMPSITAEAMNQLNGITAICITVGQNKYTSNFTNTINLEVNNSNFFLKVYSKIKVTYFLIKYIYWADVIHWTCGSILPYNFDLFLIRLLNKKAFIEWVGSDIRIPEYLMKINTTYKDVFNNGYEYSKTENLITSFKVQESFRKYNFKPILVPEMKYYLKEGLFNKVYDTQYRINSNKILPTYTRLVKSSKLKIVHAPSARIAKGSDIILIIIEKLKTVYDFEYLELNNMTHEDVLNNIKDADIFIDQIVLGSYAMAAMEAMSFGKPVISYIIPFYYEMGIPKDCPIINANRDNLYIELEKLITSDKLRLSIGKQSRLYIEKYHDSRILSNKLLAIYNS